MAAVAVAACVAITAATAPAQSEPGSSAAAGTKKLKKRLRALEDQVAALTRQPGPQGAPGATGAPGAPGAPGATSVVVRTSSSLVDPSSTSAGFGKSCNSGEVATGGGVGFAGFSAGDRIASSQPTSGAIISPDGGTPDGWVASIHNGNAAPFPRLATTFVICASP